MFWITVFNSSELFGVFICVRISSFFMCAFVLHLSCCPVIDFSLKAHSNLDALRASNTNPANFVLHEITDSCERLFQRFGIGSNVSGYPLEKIVIRSNGSGHPFEKEMLSLRMTHVICLRKPVNRSNSSDYPLEKKCNPPLRRSSNDTG